MRDQRVRSGEVGGHVLEPQLSCWQISAMISIAGAILGVFQDGRKMPIPLRATGAMASRSLRPQSQLPPPDAPQGFTLSFSLLISLEISSTL